MSEYVPHFSDPEAAREAGRKGQEARKRKAEMTAEQRALDAIGARLGRLTQELLSAALGEGDFVDLKAESRLSAVIKAMEWRLGRPTAAKPLAAPEEKPEIPLGEELFK